MISVLASAAPAAGVSTGKALIGCQEFRVLFTPVMVSRIRFHKIGTDPE